MSNYDFCPHCSSDNLKVNNTEICDEVIIMNMECRYCESTWDIQCNGQTKITNANESIKNKLSTAVHDIKHELEKLRYDYFAKLCQEEKNCPEEKYIFDILHDFLLNKTYEINEFVEDYKDAEGL